MHKEVNRRYIWRDDRKTFIADTKDQMSVQDKAALEKKLEKEEQEAKDNKPRPTEIAKSHGNKPSRGAQIDEEIENEERAELERKGKI